MSTRKPAATEIGHGWFGGGPSEKDQPAGTSSAAYPTARPVRRAGRRNPPCRKTGRALRSDPYTIAASTNCGDAPPAEMEVAYYAQHPAQQTAGLSHQ